MYKIIIFLALAVCASAQIEINGQRNYQPLHHFDVEKFTGKWYFYATIPNKFEPNTACSFANVTLNSNGTVQTILNNFNTETGYYQKWGGLAIPSGPLQSEFSYIFPPGANERNFEFKILGGDHKLEHYVVVLIVQKLSHNKSLEYVWVSSRYPNLEKEWYDHALSTLQQMNNIDINALKLHRQSDCPPFQ